MCAKNTRLNAQKCVLNYHFSTRVSRLKCRNECLRDSSRIDDMDAYERYSAIMCARECYEKYCTALIRMTRCHTNHTGRFTIEFECRRCLLPQHFKMIIDTRHWTCTWTPSSMKEDAHSLFPNALYEQQ